MTRVALSGKRRPYAHSLPVVPAELRMPLSMLAGHDDPHWAGLWTVLGQAGI